MCWVTRKAKLVTQSARNGGILTLAYYIETVVNISTLTQISPFLTSLFDTYFLINDLLTFKHFELFFDFSLVKTS